MQIHLQTLGCRLNEAELETWAQRFRALGHGICAQANTADLIVINTCAVTEDAVRKSRKLVRQVHRYNPQAKLVLSGCYASLQTDEAADLPGVDLVIDNSCKDQLPELVLDKLDMHSMPALALEPDAQPLFARGRQRAFIKVQDGCRYQCTFCIVTHARGAEKSRPITEIVAEVNTLHAQGIQEIVIAGVHLGGYGNDIQSDLTQLIRQLLEQTQIPRIRLGSLEPWDIPTHFWRLFDNPRLLPHLHLPLQSGSDLILKRMARRCKTAAFRALVEQAHDNIKDLCISTDLIVGFPGETEMEWHKTLRYLEHFTFSHMHIFSFSPRAGTRAASLTEQIDAATKAKRSQELHALGEQMRERVLRSMLNNTVEVLIETRHNSDQGANYHGYTPNYLKVQLAADQPGTLVNQIIPVTLCAFDAHNSQLIGRQKV